MKQFLMVTALISLTGVTLIPAKAIAQDGSACFMRDSSGRYIDLSSVCGGSSKNNSGVFQVKIKQRIGGIPVIDVTFNGQHKFEMLLDTGATKTTITPRMAKALRLVPIGVEKATVASGDVVEFSVGRVTSIEVGGATSNNMMVSVGPVPLLGQNFFGEYEVTIKRDVVEFRVRT